MKIQQLENCQNSPKNHRVQECICSLFCKDEASISHILSENIRWENVGKGSFEGKSIVIKALLDRNSVKITKLEILQIMSYGKDGSANGNITLED